MVASLDPEYFEFDSELAIQQSRVSPLSHIVPIAVHKEDLSKDQLKGTLVGFGLMIRHPDALSLPPQSCSTTRSCLLFQQYNISCWCYEGHVFIFVNCTWCQYIWIPPLLTPDRDLVPRASTCVYDDILTIDVSRGEPGG